MDLTTFDARAYTQSAAPLLGLDLSAEQLTKVAAAFELVMKIAAPALQAPVPAEAEPAPVFRA